MYHNQNFYYSMDSRQQPMNMQMPHSDLVNTLQNCAASCNHTLSEVIKMPDARNRQRQIQLLHDCSRICESQASYTVMNSPFAKQHANMCAMVCEECANECDKFNDPISQHCAQMCEECAIACRAFSRM